MTMTERLANHPTDQALRWWQPVTQQQTFRKLMNAFSYPGRTQTFADGSVLGSVLATLVDSEVSLSDPDGQIDELLSTRLSARYADNDEADFIVASGAIDPEWTPRLGTLSSPEYSATILIKVHSLSEGDGWELTGPGIQDTTRIQVAGLAPAWLKARHGWCANFPLGVDWILFSETQLIALPRTTRIQRLGAH